MDERSGVWEHDAPTAVRDVSALAREVAMAGPDLSGRAQEVSVVTVVERPASVGVPMAVPSAAEPPATAPASSVPLHVVPVAASRVEVPMGMVPEHVPVAGARAAAGESGSVQAPASARESERARDAEAVAMTAAADSAPHAIGGRQGTSPNRTLQPTNNALADGSSSLKPIAPATAADGAVAAVAVPTRSAPTTARPWRPTRRVLIGGGLGVLGLVAIVFGIATIGVDTEPPRPRSVAPAPPIEIAPAPQTHEEPVLAPDPVIEKPRATKKRPTPAKKAATPPRITKQPAASSETAPVVKPSAKQPVKEPVVKKPVVKKPVVKKPVAKKSTKCNSLECL
jgi:hypothetical protein